MLIFKQVLVGNMDNFAYIAGDSITKEAAVIDLGWEEEVDKILEILKKDDLQVKYIINTHCHYDHISGNKLLKEKTGGQILIHQSEKFYLDEMTESPADTGVEDNMQLTFGDVKLKFIHTPGHSPGSCCILIEDKLITGDTLFVGSIGRTDFPGSDPTHMYNSLSTKIKKLNDNIKVYPGHNYGAGTSSTIGAEKKSNPYLKANSLPEFKRLLGI